MARTGEMTAYRRGGKHQQSPIDISYPRSSAAENDQDLTLRRINFVHILVL